MTNILFDVPSVFARQFFGTPEEDRDGNWAVAGSINYMWRMMRWISDGRQVAPLFAFDGGSYFRKAMYEHYKVHRKEKPKEYHVQSRILREVLDGAGLYTCSVDGFEADDIIATAVHLGPSYIVTADTDLLQLGRYATIALLGYNRKVPDDGNFEDSFTLLSGARDVMTKYGVLPDRVAMYKAIAGDSSDNIPGVKGVGKKGALALIEKFSDKEILAGAYVDDMPDFFIKRSGGLSVAGRRIIAFGDAIGLFFDLIQLRHDVPGVGQPALIDPTNMDAVTRSIGHVFNN